MKNAIVTGSSRGFGYLTVLTLARRGYKVWATMRDPNGKNSDTKALLESIAKKEGLNIRVVDLDVANDVSVDRLKWTVMQEDGKMDVLVNNAGIILIGITEAYSIEQIKSQFETNFYGVIRTSKAFLPLLKKSDDGLIINISSLAGRLVFPFFGFYCASKFALEAYSEALRYELRPLGVDVTILEPGPYPTGPVSRGPKEDDQEVLESYGEYSETPSQLIQGFDDFFNSDDAPDPQEIPDAIVELINMSNGSRPIRNVIGIDYGTIELNEKIAPIQENHIVKNLQMAQLI